MAEQSHYDIPDHIRNAIRAEGYSIPYESMRGRIEAWSDILMSVGDFWDYMEREGDLTYRVKRRTIHPAQFVCDEWAALLLGDDTKIVTDDEQATEWLAEFLDRRCFFANFQDVVSDAFGMGTAAWSLWVDEDAGVVKPRHYDATMVFPLTWDDDEVTECAFATKVTVGGTEYDQLQMHVIEGDTYHIKTLIFDKDGKAVEFEGINPDFDTTCETPTFAVIKPAIPNRCVKFSPYGQSVIQGNEDVIKSVDACFDAIMSEVDLAKMRVLMSDTLFQVERKNGKTTYIPFGKADTTVFRRVQGSDDLIHEWAPAMRTESQKSAYRLAVQTMGQKCGMGQKYLDIDESGGLKTATEVSSDNAVLMRNIKKHEKFMSGPVEAFVKSMIQCSRVFCGESIPDEGTVKIMWDDSIIIDTAAEKAQDLSEVNVTMPAWYYAKKWYGMSEEEAKAFVPASGAVEVLPDFGM